MLLFYLILLIGAASAAKPKQNFCLEGEKTPHEIHVNKYYQCVRNRWVLLECQINYYFDRVTGFCELDLPRPPTTPPMRVCRPGSRKPDVFDNTKYLECNYDGRGYTVRYCQPEAIFVSSENMCVNIRPTYTPPTPPTYRPTTPTPTTPYYGACKESAGRDGYKPDIFNCRKFYKCASGLWTQMSCGQGTIWNQAILTCDHDRGQCSYPPRTTTYPTTWHPTTWWTTPYPPNTYKK